MCGRLHEIPTHGPAPAEPVQPAARVDQPAARALSDIAHAIASNSGNMGMERVFEAAKRVELIADGDLEGDAAVAVNCLFMELERAFEDGASLLNTGGDDSNLEESSPVDSA